MDLNSKHIIRQIKFKIPVLPDKFRLNNRNRTIYFLLVSVHPTVSFWSTSSARGKYFFAMMYLVSGKNTSSLSIFHLHFANFLQVHRRFGALNSGICNIFFLQNLIAILRDEEREEIAFRRWEEDLQLQQFLRYYRWGSLVDDRRSSALIRFVFGSSLRLQILQVSFTFGIRVICVYIMMWSLKLACSVCVLLEVQSLVYAHTVLMWWLLVNGLWWLNYSLDVLYLWSRFGNWWSLMFV